MLKILIKDDNNNVTNYQVDDVDIIEQGDDVIFQFVAKTSIIGYKLHTDSNFKEVSYIKNYLDEVIKEVKEYQYALKITEFLERQYVSIGYDENDEFNMKRFTASKF